MWPDMLVFVGVECNNSIVPGLINDYIPTLRKAYSKDVFMIYEDKSDTAPAWVNPGIGIRTTNKSKILMVSIMKNLLCQLLAMLPVDKLMFPYAPPRPAADGTRDTGGGGNGDANAISDEYHSLEEFKRQFLMFEKVVSISSTAETARYTYNGKANGQPDDLVMACLMMARIFWAIFSSRDPRYDEIRDMALAP